jgi:hypothetical protein
MLRVALCMLEGSPDRVTWSASAKNRTRHEREPQVRDESAHRGTCVRRGKVTLMAPVKLMSG